MCEEPTRLHWGRPRAYAGPLDYPSRYPMEILTRLDWFFFHDGSANAFKELVHHSPRIRDIVVTGCSGSHRYNCPFTLPASVKTITLSFTYGDPAIDQWVSTWNTRNDALLECPASNTPDMAFHHHLPHSTAIEVLPLRVTTN